VREGVDTRLIAATRHDLEERVSAGRLREDLFYRINVLTLRVPPLRERRADVPVLAERAARRASEAFGIAFGGFTAAACQALQEHAWPGNLRELASVVERAVLVADGESVAPKHLAWPTTPRAESGDERVAWVPLGERSLRSVEERLIRRVLEELDGNRSRAAKVLGINRTTLYNKLRLYGIG
jgi:DNA-binding NtrC family response regulator